MIEFIRITVSQLLLITVNYCYQRSLVLVLGNSTATRDQGSYISALSSSVCGFLAEDSLMNSE